MANGLKNNFYNLFIYILYNVQWTPNILGHTVICIWIKINHLLDETPSIKSSADCSVTSAIMSLLNLRLAPSNLLISFLKFLTF